jgi:protein gp37
MSGITSIEWTNRSWNPTTGCTRVSAGCDHCYAFSLHDMRHQAVQDGATKLPAQYSKPFSEIQLFPDRLQDPLKWKTPAKVFVNSMSDLFHKDIPDEFIQQVFAVMNQAERHTFQVLTKRPSRAALMASKLTWTSNIWLGTSIESDQVVWRADKLREVPAAIRFISAEPLLGELAHLNLSNIHWLIAGAESGRGARPMNLDWARFLRDRCQSNEVAFFLKQYAVNGKKLSLPELDGRIWNEFPVVKEVTLF